MHVLSAIMIWTVVLYIVEVSIVFLETSVGDLWVENKTYHRTTHPLRRILTFSPRIKAAKKPLDVSRVCLQKFIIPTLPKTSDSLCKSILRRVNNNIPFVFFTKAFVFLLRRTGKWHIISKRKSCLWSYLSVLREMYVCMTLVPSFWVSGL